MMWRNRPGILAGVVVLLALLLWLWPRSVQRTDGHETTLAEPTLVRLTDEQIKSIGLDIQSASPAELVFTLKIPGKVRIDSDRHIHVIPYLLGHVAEVHRGSGDKVSKGELLAVLESQEMAEAAADYLAALAKERLAATLLSQEEALAQKKIIAEQEHLTAQAAYQQAKIDFKLARHKLQTYGMSDEAIERLTQADNPNLRRYEIRSPMDGVVVNRNLTRGAVVEPNTTIYEVADLSHVLVEIGVFPKDQYCLKRGQTARVSIPSQQLMREGKVCFVSPVMSDCCITSTSLIELDNSEGLWRPGTIAQVQVLLDKRPVSIAIPDSALQTMEGDTVVFVRVPEGFEKRVVRTGQADGQLTEIVEGLEPGESYATGHTFLLKAELGKDSVEDD